MATSKPRMMITIEPRVKQLLDELAEASGQPASRFVSEMLTESADALFIPMIEAMKMAKEKKSEAWDVLNHALARTQHQAAQMSLAIHEEQAKARKKRGRNATKK